MLADSLRDPEGRLRDGDPRVPLIAPVGEASEVAGQLKVVGAVDDDVGALPPEYADEQSQLEDHVVARDYSGLPTHICRVAGRGDEHSEVGAVGGLQKRLHREVGELEDALTPRDRFARSTTVQSGLQVVGDLDSLRGRADENGRQVFGWG